MLKIKSLEKDYKSKEGIIHHALRNINLEFDNKGFVVILGKSGSGKSTLLNIIGGLDYFDRGELLIHNKSTKDFTPKDWDAYRNTYVGNVFQEFYLIDQFSIGKNIALSLELQGYPKDQIERRVKSILEEVELNDLFDRQTNEISGGQKQRIAIARALIKNPQIILADEPTGNLDSETGKIVLQILKKLSKEKLVIMVTHDREFAYEYGDRIIELKDGAIIYDELNISFTKDLYEVNGEIESVIRVKRGMEFPQSIIDYLNDLNDENDLQIQVSDQKSSIIKFIPELQNLEKRKTVNTQEIPFVLKKSSLPFKHAIKLAYRSLMTKKVKLFMMTFLFVMSLTLLGVASIFSFYDVSKTLNFTLTHADASVVPFNKCSRPINEGFCHSNVSIHDDEIDALTNKYP